LTTGREQDLPERGDSRRQQRGMHNQALCHGDRRSAQGTLQMESGGTAAVHLYRFYGMGRARIREGHILLKVSDS